MLQGVSKRGIYDIYYMQACVIDVEHFLPPSGVWNESLIAVPLPALVCDVTLTVYSEYDSNSRSTINSRSVVTISSMVVAGAPFKRLRSCTLTV